MRLVQLAALREALNNATPCHILLLVVIAIGGCGVGVVLAGVECESGIELGPRRALKITKTMSRRDPGDEDEEPLRQRNHLR